MLSVATCCRRASASSKSVFDTKVDVKRFETRPKNKVTAKPRIGPVPNWNRNAAEIERAGMRVDERQEHAAEARVDGGPNAALRLELLLDALEDQHVRVDAHAHRQDEAGDAGQRHRRADVRHQAEQNHEVEEQRDDRVDAGQLVVDQHEEHDQHQADDARP